jgi:hypothetical protein
VAICSPHAVLSYSPAICTCGTLVLRDGIPAQAVGGAR